jgi:hypothetical protein
VSAGLKAADAWHERQSGTRQRLQVGPIGREAERVGHTWWSAAGPTAMGSAE